jgi:hypothetical protein
MIWSVLSLAASLLFCAAILLGLGTGTADRTSLWPDRTARALEPHGSAHQPVVGQADASEDVEPSDDARVVRVSAGVR